MMIDKDEGKELAPKDKPEDRGQEIDVKRDKGVVMTDKEVKDYVFNGKQMVRAPMVMIANTLMMQITRHIWP